MRLVGFLKVVVQILFILYLPILRILSRVRINVLIEDAGLFGKELSSFFIKQFDSVNSEE